VTTELIHWGDAPSGSHGTFGPFSFIVSPAYSGGGWMLVTYLPGMEDRRARGGLGEVKAIAESWLREFASSLGALFAADLRQHLTEQVSIHQEHADDCDEMAGEASYREACRYWGAADALRDVLKYLDREADRMCPGGCGCRLGTDDADRRECGCDEGCCGEEDPR
jgi:hypothetical protein